MIFVALACTAVNTQSFDGGALQIENSYCVQL